jgi:hypothetical protein
MSVLRIGCIRYYKRFKVPGSEVQRLDYRRQRIPERRAALDSAEPFGPELTADGLVAGCGCQKPAASKG